MQTASVRSSDEAEPRSTSDDERDEIEPATRSPIRVFMSHAQSSSGDRPIPKRTVSAAQTPAATAETGIDGGPDSLDWYEVFELVMSKLTCLQALQIATA